VHRRAPGDAGARLPADRAGSTSRRSRTSVARAARSGQEAGRGSRARWVRAQAAAARRAGPAGSTTRTGSSALGDWSDDPRGVRLTILMVEHTSLRACGLSDTVSPRLRPPPCPGHSRRDGRPTRGIRAYHGSADMSGCRPGGRRRQLRPRPPWTERGIAEVRRRRHGRP